MSYENPLEGTKTPPLPARRSIPPMPPPPPGIAKAPQLRDGRSGLASVRSNITPSPSVGHPVPPAPVLQQQQPTASPRPPWEVSRAPEIGAQAVQRQEGHAHRMPYENYPSNTQGTKDEQVHSTRQMPVPVQPVAVEQKYPPGKSLAVASMVLGIFTMTYGINAIISVFMMPLSIVGLILGIVAAVKAKNTPPRSGKGQAIAGIVLNSLALMITISIVFFLSSMFYAFTSSF